MFISKEKLKRIEKVIDDHDSDLETVIDDLNEADASIVELQQKVADLVEENKAVSETLESSRNRVNELEMILSDHATRLASLDSLVKDYLEYQKKKEAEDPFIEVITDSFDEKTGVEIKLDWNPAMINYLKRNGYRGIDDDEIIMKYVADMFNDKVVKDDLKI